MRIFENDINKVFVRKATSGSKFAFPGIFFVCVCVCLHINNAKILYGYDKQAAENTAAKLKI